MALTPISIPPGVYRNGTDMQAAGRWNDASLVRWSEGIMAPVGGWNTRFDLASNPIRGSVAWQDNSSNIRVAAGSYDALYGITAGGIASDITPAGLTEGVRDAIQNLGYGGGFYGVRYYGTPRDASGLPVFATSWSLDTWGEYLVACSDADGVLYEWQLDPATPAQAITNAPTDCLALMVTDERFLFALGAGGDPRKVQWSDREDNTTWTPLATNEAGDIPLQTSGQIMCGIRVRGQALILTNQDAHTATYSGPPFVYGFERVGSDCGTISRKAAASVSGGAMWMGRNGFFSFSSGAVQRMPCDVSDHVFNNINKSQISKVHAITLGTRNEVWWFYPVGDDCDNYVAYNYIENHWSIGQLDRSSGISSGVFETPIMFSKTGVAYNHETGFTHGGLTPYVESGPISIGAGDQMMCATDLIPDEKTQGEVTATFKTRFYPNGPERSYGPYTMSTPTSVRFTGRQVRMRVEAVSSQNWRVGVMRLDVTPGGRR
jgi:hypothetical protein